VLSRQIRAPEDELKAQLFARDRRGTELTRAGRQLLADAGPMSATCACRPINAVCRFSRC
jgi:DNA-binding transcriptional LysR family regulator